MLRKIIRCALCAVVLFGIITGTVSCSDGSSVEKNTPVKNTPDKVNEEKAQVGTSNAFYPHANSHMVYFPLYGGKLEQWSLDGAYLQTVALPVERYKKFSDDITLLWVSDTEIIWMGENKNADQKVLSTPLISSDSREELAKEQTKELFTLKWSWGNDMIYGATGGLVGETGTVYADENYFTFLSDGSFYIYDRKAGGKPARIPLDDYAAHLPDFALSLASEVVDGKVILHTGRTAGMMEEDAYEFWACPLDGGKPESIDSRCFSDAAFVADPARGAVYYQITSDQSIWRYDCQTGQKDELISEEQFHQCFDENHLAWDDAYYNDSLFVSGDTLYFVKNMEHPRVFSYSLAEKSLSYEQALTESLRNSARHFDGLAIIEDKLLLYGCDDDFDKEYYICIDIPSAKAELVSKKDSDKIYFGMIGAWENPGTTGKWEKIKPEQPDDQESPGAVSDSEDVQLACIAQNWGMWQEEPYDFSDVIRYFAITDLDHNGRLELIAASGLEGSGAFTTACYYQVSADGTKLLPISNEAGEVDIVNGIDTAYVDKATGTYYYCAQDYASGGAGSRWTWYGAITLKNGMLTDRTYAIAESRLTKKANEVWSYFYYEKGKEKKIAAKKFHADRLAARLFAGCEKQKVTISWFTLGGKKRASRERILQKATESWKKFQVG